MTIGVTDLAFTPAAELARLIASQALSPVELVDGVLARIERAQSTLNPFITVTAEEARAAARAAEAVLMRGDARGPLFGVPFSVKDLVNTAGVWTTFGSVALADNVPHRRRVRQPVLHHADHPHGDGQRLDAAGDGRP